jgi:acyl-coenzyme A thioesterase PaaI-like protein
VSADAEPVDDSDRAWTTNDPDRLVARGHNAGDFLEAWEWTVLERGADRLVLEVHLPEHLKNPRDQLFGGFTPVYVDFVALYTVRSAEAATSPNIPFRFFNTINMRCDYFEPIMGPTFHIVGEIENRRGQICLVSTKFLATDGSGPTDGTMLAHALTTLRVPPA